MKKIVLSTIALVVLLGSAAFGQIPTFSSAATTSATNIRVTFNGGSNLTAIPGGFAGFTVTGATVTAASIVGGPGASLQVDLTVNPISTGFTCASCVAIANNTVTNGSGNNNNIPAAGNNVTDGAGPTVTVNQGGGQADPTNSSPVTFTVVFSEAINPGTFTDADMTLGGTATGQSVNSRTTSDNITWTVTIAATGPGTIVPTMGTPRVQDGAGNNNLASTSTDNSVTFDNGQPTVTINQGGGQLDPTTTSPVTFTIVFNEAINPATFANGDITLGGTATGQSVNSLTTGDNITWTLTIAATGQGTIIPSLAASVVQDPAGNNNQASTSTDNSVTFDQVPSVTINQGGGQSDPTNVSPVTFTVVFSEAINPGTFADGDITLGGTATGKSVVSRTTSDNITWTVTIAATGTGTIIPSIAAAAVQDPTGNNNLASTSSDNTVLFDNSAPDVTINQGGGQSDPTNISPVTFTVVFTEAINPATFTSIDITLGGTATGKSVSNLTTSDNITWTLTIAATGSGTIIPSINASTVQDPAGNNNTASTSTDNQVLFDIDGPTVTINQDGGQSDPTATSPIIFTAVFSEAINPGSFVDGDITLGGTATGKSVVSRTTADNITWTITIAATGSGTVIPSLPLSAVQDPLGNTSAASTSTDNTVTFDNTGPSVTINQGGGQSDPTNVSPVTFTVVFSEAINPGSFVDGDITLGGTATGKSIVSRTTADNITWTVTIAATGTGTIIPSLAVGVVQDPLGNTSLASTSTDNTVLFDNTPPDVAINQGGGQSDPTNVSPVTFTAVFTEAINPATFANGDITLGGTATGKAIVSRTTSDNITWTITISATGSGTIIPSIGAGVVQDPAGNNNTASTSTDNTVTYDIIAPTVTILRQIPLTSPTSANTITFRVTFNESVTNVDLADFDGLTSSSVPVFTLSTVTPVSSTIYDVQFTGVVGQTTDVLNLDFAVGQNITDAAGNPFAGAITLEETYVVDNTLPALNPDEIAINLNGASPETLVFTLNEELNIPNGPILGFTTSTGTIATAVYSGKGTTNTITLTSTADADWTTATTVTYAQVSGNAVDLIGLEMANFTKPVVQNIVNLAAGDIIFTSFRSDDPNNFSFVLMKPISTGTVIKFTNNGVKSDQTFRTGEETLTWTTTANLPAGREITITGSPSVSSAGGTITGDTELTLSTSGDQIFAYQGNSTSPTFIAGLHFNGTAFDANSTDENTSVLPTGLTAGTYVRVDEIDNAAYNFASEITTGSVPQLRTNIIDQSNWDVDNTATNVTYPTAGNNFTIIPVIAASGIAIPNSLAKVGDTRVATITVDDDYGSVHTLTSGTIGGFPLFGLNRTNSTTYTASFTVTEGGTDVAAGANMPVANFRLTNSYGNQSAIYSTPIVQTSDAIDANSPKVVSIVRQSATTPWSTTSFGTSASSVVFRVTFNESINPATLSAADFALAPVNVNTTLAVIGAPVVVTPNTVFDITVSGYTGTGTLGLNYVDNEDANAVQDPAGNSTITSVGVTDGDFTGQVYSIVLPEPTENVDNTTVTTIPTNTSIQITWTEPTPAPTHYLLVARATSGGSFPAPFDVINGNEDGTVITPDLALGDGSAGVIVPAGTNTHTFSGLQSGTSYDFVIYVYNLSANNAPDNADYRTTADATPPTAIPAFSVFTTTASVGTIAQGPVAAPSTIHSITGTSYVGTNFSFILQDDGLSPGDDNSKTRFHTLVVTANAGNSVTDWNGVIASARLTDVSAVPGAISGTSITATSITSNSIVFTGIGTTTNALGSLEDNQTKEYRLEIQLKANINGAVAGATKETIDNTRFEFFINAASFTHEAGSSMFAPAESENSDPLNNDTNNRIDVNASTLAFSTQPLPSSLVLTNVTSIAVAPDFSTRPVIRAVDANGNTDRNYTNNVSLATAGAPIAPSTLFVDSPSPNAGVYTFPVGVQYTDDGAGPPANGTLTASATAVTNGVSNAIDVSYSATSTLVVGAAPSATISDLTNTSPGQDVFNFVVTDDGGVGGDGSPTRISQIIITQGPGNNPVLSNWTQAIAGARLSDGTNVLVGTVNAANITFPAINTATLGFISDSQPKTYTLSIWLHPALGGTLPATIDNKSFDFQVTSANITLTSLSSTLIPAQSVNSGAGNTVTVVADRLVYTTQPPATAFVLTDLTTTPVAEARNVNGNRDLNYTGAGNTVTISNTEAIPMSGNTLVPSAGVITFPANFQYLDDGTGVLGNATLTLTGSGIPAVTPVTSNTVTVSYDNNNRIIASGGHVEALTFSSLNNGPAHIPVFDFSIVDDNGNSPAGDGSPTRFSQVVITQQTGNDVANWQEAIASATLTVGASTLVGTINPTNITFSGIASALSTDPGHIVDGGTKTYTLNIYLQTAMGGNLRYTVDNLNLAFEILESNITLTTQSSNFTAVGTQSQASGATNNAVNVAATKLTYVQLGDATNNWSLPLAAFPTGASINTPFAPGALGASAEDINGNRDLDFVSQVSAFSANGLSTELNPLTPVPPAPGSGPALFFSAGTLTFPVNFVYTSGNNQNGRITINAGTITTNNVSPDITIASSKDAYVYFNPTYSYPALINSVNQQGASLPASTSAISVPSDPVASLGELILSDGGATSYEASGNTTHTPTSDSDGAFTRISQIQFSVTNHTNLRTLALYNSAGVKISSDVASGPTVNFTGLNIQAPDNGSIAFTVRTTFNSSITADHVVIQLRVTGVTQSAGSLLYEGAVPPNPSYVGGILNGDLTPISKNRIDVVATQLVYTQNPPAFAGINEPVPYSGTPATTLEARDANNNLDTDFDFALRGTMGDISSAAALVTSSFPFASGVLNLGSIRYNGTGNGTLTVSVSTGLPFVIEGVPGPVIAAPSVGVSSTVDVIHTTAALATGGVIPGPTANLAGGAVDRVIYGITFTAPYQAGGHPDLNRFVINFGLPPGTPINTILSNWRIYENTSGTFGGPNITSLTGAINMINSDQELEVVFGTPRDLSTPKSYFLQVDVVPSASGSTPPIRPQVIDDGYLTSTEGNIVTTRGSAKATVQGNIYNFSAIFPPELTGSYPATGQLNVSINQPKISLRFSVPVWTLDNTIYLNDQTNPSAPAVALTADNGQYSLSSGGTVNNRVNPVIFSIPPGSLQADHVYYITVAPGVFNGAAATDNTGFMDEAGNRFPGISYPGTLYFKTANPNPPNMLSTPTAPSNPGVSGSVVGGTVSATFDRSGRAYYLILPNGTPTPTPDQITGIAPHGSAVARGNFNINQVNPVAQFGTFSPLVPLVASTTYDVWMSATSNSEISLTGLPADATTSQVPASSPLHFGSIAKLTKTGTISTSLTSNVVTGIGTQFTTELLPGRTLFDATGTNLIGVIATITDNFTLTLAANAQNALTNQAYQVSGFERGAAGPTLSFTPTAAPASVTVSNPNLTICSDSYQILSEPLIISESNSGSNFSGGGTQSINFVLPAGFEFDTEMSGLNPKYGTLTLIGTDFTGGGSPQMSFIGSSIVKISYLNSGSASVDKIIIAGLRVKANSATSGQILRFGGNALTVAIPDLTAVATISASAASGISFYNSYSLLTFNNTAVTTIPDNFSDPNLSQSLATQLFPAPPFGDYGPSSFSGQGVNVNLLNLTAVTLGTPFNITINHVDNNGCPSSSSEQYTVYDHRTAIADLSTEYCTPNDQFAISNPQALATTGLQLSPVSFNRLQSYYLDGLSADVPLGVTDPDDATKVATDQIIFGTGWRNILNRGVATGTVTVSDVSTTVTGTGTLFTTEVKVGTELYDGTGTILLGVVRSIASNTSLTLSTNGLVAGGYSGGYSRSWLLQRRLYTPGSSVGGVAIGPGGGYLPLNNPLPGPPAHEYFDYILDRATLLNAKSLEPSISKNPYDYFAQTSPQGNVYYTGGSIGVVQYTGTFQSIANASVRIPLLQNVRYFVPAVPIIETNPPSYLDTADPLNPPGAGNPGGPALGPGGARSSNRGTPVFCVLGGQIIINAFPAAAPGSSLGRFTVIDHTNPTNVLYDNPPGGPAVNNAGFKDNTNGTASIDPTIAAIQNGFRDIRIIYTFKENNSPCTSTATQVIRISPNPVANFTFASTPGPLIVGTGSTCATQPITFTSTAASTDPINNTIQTYTWNFGDPSSPTNNGSGLTLSHVYDDPSTPGVPYITTHSVVSFYNCPSVTPTTPSTVQSFTRSINVGGIPTVRFSTTGIARGDAFTFVSTNGGPTTTSANDAIASYTWDFGQGAPGTNINVRDAADGLTTNAQFNADVVNFTYSQMGPQLIDLTVATTLGCRNSLSLQNTYRSIVVLDRVVFNAPTDVYAENFETSGANWQVWGTGADLNTMVQSIATSSWAHGSPANPFGAAYQTTYDLIMATKAWKTNPTGNYNPNERSALYSPSFNLGALLRPMISFNAIVQTELSDGVVLEYSVDNLNVADPNKLWITLGVINDGEDWYNANGIAGKPGTQTANDFGWSGVATTRWQEPKHTLDVVGGSNRAVFRFALGSASGGITVPGFWLDNVRIGDRTRTILLESFANTGNDNAAEKTENDAVAAFQDGSVGTEVVKLNYHVNFPKKDPFNEDNPADPSSRALFYNITTTPRSVLDGLRDETNVAFSSWGQSEYDIRSLRLAQADLTINETANADGSLSISVDVKSNVNTGLGNAILHVVVLEKDIALSALPSAKQAMVLSGETSFEYVVKAMLPSASGTDFGSTLSFNSTRSFGPFIWRPEASKLYANANDLAIAVFLQSKDAPYEVYQVELLEPVNDPPVVTGLEPLANEQVLAYPNPAHHELTVQLPGALAKPAVVNLVDQTGRVALKASIPEGADRKTLNVSDLAGGIYILTVDMGQGVLARKKVMIVHQD